MNLRNGTKEIKRREEAGGGGDSGGGGWFGWGGRFGWSNGDNFWPEAQQTSLARPGYYCHGNGLTLISSKILRNASLDGPSDFSSALKNGVSVEVSAKESVKRKWGSD